MLYFRSMSTCLRINLSSAIEYGLLMEFQVRICVAKVIRLVVLTDSHFEGRLVNIICIDFPKKFLVLKM